MSCGDFQLAISWYMEDGAMWGILKYSWMSDKVQKQAIGKAAWKPLTLIAS